MPGRRPCLLFAYVEFRDKKYLDLWKTMDADPSDLEIRRNRLILRYLQW